LLKIYGDSNSGNCYKIKLTCHLLNVRYDWIEIKVKDFKKKETLSAEMIIKNPNGKIPFIQLEDDLILTESNAIINYLSYDSKLLPKNKLEIARLQEWQFFEQYSHEPFIAVARYIKKFLNMPTNRKEEYSSLHAKGYKALSIMEKQLGLTNYLVGNNLSTADISLYAYTHVAHEGGFDLSLYINIQSWIKRIQSETNYVKIGI
jgi:glutathione S-transferase